MSNTNFTLEYALSLIVTLIVIQLLVQRNPSMSKVSVVIGGLVVAYVSLVIIHFISDKLLLISYKKECLILISGLKLAPFLSCIRVSLGLSIFPSISIASKSISVDSL